MDSAEFQTAIRDPDGIWYGPHACENCGSIIVRRSRIQGPPLSLDAGDFNHHYPNFQWKEHVCGAEDEAKGRIKPGSKRYSSVGEMVEAFGSEELKTEFRRLQATAPTE